MHRMARQPHLRADHHILPVDSRDSGYNWLCSHSGYNNLCIAILQQFCIHLCVHADLCPTGLQLFLQPLFEMIQLLLKGHALGKIQGTAQLIAFFIQGHIMALLHRFNRALHAGRAAADHSHTLFLSLRHWILPFQLPANFRVQRADRLLAHQQIGSTGEAAHTLDDFLRLPQPSLFGQIRIAEQGTAQAHNVRLAGLEYFLHQVRISQGAHGCDGALHMFFHFRS